MPGDDRGVAAFNELGSDEAGRRLTTCMHAPGWVGGVLAGRPYPDRAGLLAEAHRLGAAMSDDDLEAALSAHPRIGERREGDENSEREQGGVDAADQQLADELRAGNLAYEERFGRVFLIRAAGLTGPQILAALRERLGNDDEAEVSVVRNQLTLIAQLRLGALLDELAA